MRHESHVARQGVTGAIRDYQEQTYGAIGLIPTVADGNTVVPPTAGPTAHSPLCFRADPSVERHSFGRKVFGRSWREFDQKRRAVTSRPQDCGRKCGAQTRPA